MSILDVFKKKGRHDLETRRSFIRNSLGVMVGATALANADNVFATKSKTGFIYVKQNGEVINDYDPRGGNLPYIGQLTCVGFNFAPVGWVMCNGQLLPISQYETLFVLYGTTYGGDGKVTFAVPDLQGRVPMHMGQGPGLSNYFQGQTGGEEEHTLTVGQMPQHNHTLNVNSAVGTSNTPTGNFLAQNADGINEYAGSSNTTMNAGSLSSSGSNLPHDNMQPYLVLNWIVATEGVFPTH